MTIAADIMTLALREARDEVKARLRRQQGAGADAKLSIRELTELGKRELTLKHHLRAADICHRLRSPNLRTYATPKGSLCPWGFWCPNLCSKSEALMPICGYARVSTVGQSHDVQMEALRGAGVERTFAEKVTGKNAQRPQLQALLRKVMPGGSNLPRASSP